MFDMAQFIAEAIKENGLVLPVNFTEEEFFEAGRCLAKIEQGMQWAIGDWYNAIPWGDKEKACKEAGLSFNSAKQNGLVAELFKIGERSPILGYTHHLTLAIQDLTDEQRADLLEKARENKWSSAALKHERDKVLGRPEKVATLEFDQQVESLLQELPATVSKKAKNEVRKVYGDMKREFITAVEKEVSKRLQVEKAKLRDIEADIKAQQAHIARNAAGITPLMTQEEFRLVRSLLHPDKHPENQDRYKRAFEIFNRLGEAINPNIPIAVLRKEGWA